MTRTLHWYLARDLLKVTLLSAVAFTLLLTVLAIVQPLRKMGLGTEQVLRLFGFTLPLMISLTLPVATLFAATFVYGRFSQDNELLACRVSGVATLALLKPALVLGAAVTVISLLLSNFVAPMLASRAGAAIQANLRGYVYQPLKRQQYIEFGKFGSRHIVHADVVNAEENTLHGVVYAQVRRRSRPVGPSGQREPDTVSLLSASTAYMDFRTSPDGKGWVAIQLINPSVIQTSDGSVYQESSQPFVLPLENPIEEKPSWYSWHRLLRTLEDPSLYGEISRKFTEIKQWICTDLLAQDVVKAVRAGEGYAELVQGDERYELTAPKVEVDDEGTAVLSAVVLPDAARRPVVVTVRRGRRIVQTVEAQRCKVMTAWSPATRKPQVTLKMAGDVTVRLGPPGRQRVHRPADWVRGEIPVPEAIQARAKDIQLSEVYADPERFTSNKRIISRVKSLKTVRIPKLRAALIAELHARVAYGVSCFLMVAMGGALGLIFRGGQFISAFAISVVPASVVIAVLLMGKEIVRNPDVDMAYGLLSIWGGIVLLLAANVLIYWHLARK